MEVKKGPQALRQRKILLGGEEKSNEKDGSGKRRSPKTKHGEPIMGGEEQNGCAAGGLDSNKGKT